MVRPQQNSLKLGHRKAIGLDALPENVAEDTINRLFKDERAELLKDIPPHIVKKAWFTMAHTLLDSGAVVMDAGCRDGAMTYTIAALFPDLQVIGLDMNAEVIKEARETYRLPNLKFQLGNLYSDLPPNSVDVIINSFLLHEIYSTSLYNERQIQLALEKQYEALREGGSIIIRDYVTPPAGEYVLIEFKDEASLGDDVNSLSEADLMIWFSENARAQYHPDGAGFFLEELPPNYPRTRLFRVPAKWAYEFILRKDDRKKLKEELAKEYAFYTEQEFRKVLRSLGARVTYSAPHWDEGFIKSRYVGHLRLYKEDGTKMGPPATNHILVAQKIGEYKSQLVQERRASRARAGSVYLRTMRDERSGAITDIVCRDLELAEVLAFRVTADNKLKVYLHEGVPRGLANSVPRSGRNLDGRRWSGHMTEAISLPVSEVVQVKDLPNSDLQKFSVKTFGLRPSLDGKLIEGGGFYPDPTRIDERILTYYMRVEDYHPSFEAKHVLMEVEGYSTRGRIREMDAQSVLNAIAVGFLPSSRLEVQILTLYRLLGLKAEIWGEMPLQLSEIPVEEVTNINSILKKYSQKDDRFKPIKGSAGNIRLVQSVFVDEGSDEGGGMTGLAAKDMEFVVPEDNTVNTAVVLPLVKDLSGEVLAGIVTEYLPVPQRYSGTGMMVTLPSFPLPKDVTDIDAARYFVAEQFKVKPEFVARMGESYFTHIGLTPHRIYPFVVTSVRFHYSGGVFHGATALTPLSHLCDMLYWDNHDSFLKIAAMAYQYLCDSDMSVKRDFDFKISDSFSKPRAHESSIFSPNSGSGPSSTPLANSASGASQSIFSESDFSSAEPTPDPLFRFPR